MPNLLNRLSYFKEVGEELQKVTWPSRQQTIQLTKVVIGVTLVIGLYISALDFMFTKLIELFL